MKASPEKIRIDKWLWAVRLFKSRSLAAEVCEKGKIRMGDQTVKASRSIRIGDVISVRRGPFTSQFEVLQLTENRLPAKAAASFCKDVTPMDELGKMKLHVIRTTFPHDRGQGRPTKKDRRDLDSFTEW